MPPPARPDAAVDDHVREGGDDFWLPGVTPRPSPVGSQILAEPEAPAWTRVAAPHRWRRLPQALVVGSLVAATAGYASVSDVTATAGSVPQFVRDGALVAAETVEPAVVAADLGNERALVAGEDGLLRVRETDEASRSSERTLLPGCDGVPPETEQDNGNMDERFLCTLWDGQTEIRADAAVALAVLNETYRADFGRDICLTDGYRSLGQQESLRQRKPGLAARPGTSDHGVGLAVDMCGGVNDGGSNPAYVWMMEHAPEAGFVNPDWAQSGGSGPYEPWHWEYLPGKQAQE